MYPDTPYGEPLGQQEQPTYRPLPAAVYLVGAGPGDPELLTLKAHRLLSQADVVLIADSLVPEQLVQMVRADAELVRTADQTLEQMVPLMIDRVRSRHQSVVRLQSGDPSLYSTIHEQMQALAEADVPFEVIPGISAFQAAAARLKVELTIPGVVQTIILTRISGRTYVPPAEELSSLAAHQASLCLYLSARHVETAQAKLLQHYPADTPVAVCFRLGWPDEQIWLVPLTEMVALSQQENLVRTTLYLISPALAARMPSKWPQNSDLPNAEANSSRVTTADSKVDGARSRLYSPTHPRLFRDHRDNNSV